IAINRDAFGAGEVSRSIAMLAKEADKVSVGIENLYAIVKRVGHVDIAIGIQRHALRRAKVTGSSEEVILPAGSDASQQLQAVCVVDDDLILLRIHHVEKTVRRVDGDSNRILQSLCDLIF